MEDGRASSRPRANDDRLYRNGGARTCVVLIDVSVLFIGDESGDDDTRAEQRATAVRGSPVPRACGVCGTPAARPPKAHACDFSLKTKGLPRLGGDDAQWVISAWSAA
ncbi:TPA: hypothetical protein SAO08_001051 [Burkholderia multivorans]|uniref:hypothetical protein n=1 Tax=Burkholderia multivorans TaxID=87883 RepID=UPI00158A9598|nr:hypothetical protein [Burkholderia multivorans]MBU9313254.1 hypothetical protein [Burkholderia multivorans]MDN7938630.1 hypothetical protein [Burkholderia multivorans]HEF4741243.1 hypothetical protein [Burkholderia multivorans]